MCSYTHTTSLPPLLSHLALVKLPSHKVDQSKGSRDKIKTQKKETLRGNSKTHPRKFSVPVRSGRQRQEGGGRVVREERASTRRAGPRPDPHATLFSSGCCADLNRVSNLGPRPLCGHRRAPGSQRSQPDHLSKGLDNKRRAGRKSGGGEIQSLPSPSEEGVCLPFTPF